MIPQTEPDVLGIDWHKDGPYNRMASPHVRISEDEFLRLAFTTQACLQSINYDQVYLDEDENKQGVLWDVRYYVFYNLAIAVASTYVSKRNLFTRGMTDLIHTYKDAGAEIRVDRILGGALASTARALCYYRIGCLHPYEVEVKIGNCLYRQGCPDCGYTTEIDSSG